MSGNNETGPNSHQARHEVVRQRRQEASRRAAQTRRRRTRNNSVKRNGVRAFAIVLMLILIAGSYVHFTGFVLSEESVTHVIGHGQFDSIVVDFEQYGDYDAKAFFVIVESSDEVYIGVSDNIETFYNKSIQFFVTVYVDGLAQPTEIFVLRTTNLSIVACKNNITVSFDFGAREVILIPVWKLNVLVTIGMVAGIIFGFPPVLWIVWVVSGGRWGY